MSSDRGSDTDMIDVRSAAKLVDRHPETVRRWVWAGRLQARRQGNRLLLARADVEAVLASEGRSVSDLATWADRARELRRRAPRSSGASAASVVIAERAERANREIAGS